MSSVGKLNWIANKVERVGRGGIEMINPYTAPAAEPLSPGAMAANRPRLHKSLAFLLIVVWAVPIGLLAGLCGGLGAGVAVLAIPNSIADDEPGASVLILCGIAGSLLGAFSGAIGGCIVGLWTVLAPRRPVMTIILSCGLSTTFAAFWGMLLAILLAENNASNPVPAICFAIVAASGVVGGGALGCMSNAVAGRILSEHQSAPQAEGESR